MTMQIEETTRFLCINQKQVYRVLNSGQLKVNKLNGRKVIIPEGIAAQKRPLKP